jgi:hypothetical protein
MVGAVIAYNMSFINHSSHKVRTGSCVMHIDDKNTLNIFFLQGVQDGGGKVVVLVSKSKCQIDLFSSGPMKCALYFLYRVSSSMLYPGRVLADTLVPEGHPI